jgi:hypothetical protein
VDVDPSRVYRTQRAEPHPSSPSEAPSLCKGTVGGCVRVPAYPVRRDQTESRATGLQQTVVNGLECVTPGVHAQQFCSANGFVKVIATHASGFWTKWVFSSFISLFETFTQKSHFGAQSFYLLASPLLRYYVSHKLPNSSPTQTEQVSLSVFSRKLVLKLLKVSWHFHCLLRHSCLHPRTPLLYCC